MSQANVEIAKRALDALTQRDLDLDGDLYAPDFEWYPALPGNVEGGSYRGLEGAERYREEVRNTWGELRVVADELRDLGDRVLMLGRMEGRGRGSGVQVDASLGIVADFRGGKIARIRAYLDHGEALRAAGLSA
jgi:ketosteroid isomerase-like protein